SLLTAEKAPPKFAIPAVIEMTQDAAVAKLTAAGFKPAITTANNPAEKGTVFDQSPVQGLEFPANTVVTISVSNGPGEIPVPDVTGFTEDSAKASIRNAGLTVGEVQLVEDPRIAKGKVVETVPAAGVTATTGSPVVL